jgi:hypothetical protein
VIAWTLRGSIVMSCWETNLLCLFFHLGEKNKGTYKSSWACKTRQRLVHELDNPIT